MNNYVGAVETLTTSCRRLFASRDYYTAEKQRHQTEVTNLQLQINSVSSEIDALNAAIVQLGGGPVMSAGDHPPVAPKE